MKIVGCDLHAKQQTIAMVDTDTGEFIDRTLSHEGSAVPQLYAELEGGYERFSCIPAPLDSCASGFRYECTSVCPSESHEY
jgi:hypothetical protein